MRTMLVDIAPNEDDFSMSDIFDAMHQAMFDRLFSLDEEGREAKARLLREAGLSEDDVAELTKPGILPGMSFGGAKAVDVTSVVERCYSASGLAAYCCGWCDLPLRRGTHRDRSPGSRPALRGVVPA